MSSILRFSESNPLRIVPLTFSGLNSLDPQTGLFKTWSIPWDDAFFQPFNQADQLTIQFDSSFDATNVIKVRAYNTGTAVITVNATEAVDRTTYKVYQNTIDISALSGKYYVTIEGTHTSPSASYEARSEPIEIKADHCRSSIIEYYSFKPFDGIDYRTGVIFYLRVPAIFIDDADENEESAFDDSGYNRIKKYDITRQARVFRFNHNVPSWVIKKVNRVLQHDYTVINGLGITSGEKLQGSFTYFDFWDNPTVRIPLLQNGIPNIELSGDRAVFPERVTDLAGVGGVGEIVWTWTAEADVVYKIYTSDAEFGTYVLLATLAIGVGTRTETGLTGGEVRWAYVIGTRDGLDSLISNRATATALGVYEIYAADPLNDNAEIG